MRFLGLISYPDPSLILSLVEVQSLIQSDSPLVAILKFAVSSWCEAWDRGIFGAARISSSFNSANDYIFPRVFQLSQYIWVLNLGSRGLFLESPGNFACAESCFVFAAFTVKIKVSIILKIIKWNHQLTNQTWLIYGLGSVLLFNRPGFDFKICFQARKVSGPFEKRTPDLARVDGKIQNGNHRKQILSSDKVINLHLNIINWLDTWVPCGIVQLRSGWVGNKWQINSLDTSITAEHVLFQHSVNLINVCITVV